MITENIENYKVSFLGSLLTGIIIGAGSKPINFLMSFLLNRKIVAIREEVQKNDNLGAAPASGDEIENKEELKLQEALQVDIENQIGISYRGGDRPERLEYTHLFKQRLI